MCVRVLGRIIRYSYLSRKIYASLFISTQYNRSWYRYNGHLATITCARASAPASPDFPVRRVQGNPEWRPCTPSWRLQVGVSSQTPTWRERAFKMPNICVLMTVSSSVSWPRRCCRRSCHYHHHFFSLMRSLSSILLVSLRCPYRRLSVLRRFLLSVFYHFWRGHFVVFCCVDVWLIFLMLVWDWDDSNLQ